MSKVASVVGMGCAFVAGCLLGLSAGGCYIGDREPSLKRYLVDAQASVWQGRGHLTTWVDFRDLEDLRDFGLDSYEIVSEDGSSFAMSGLGMSVPKGGGRCISFDVDVGRIPGTAETITCQYNISVYNSRYVLKSAFVRDPTAIGEWRILRDRLKLEPEPLAE